MQTRWATALTVFPKEIWSQIWSNKPIGRLHREIRRRSDVVWIFPNSYSISIVRLIGAVRLSTMYWPATPLPRPRRPA